MDKTSQFLGTANEIETTKNKVDRIDNDSTHTQYPSAKAVKNYFDNLTLELPNDLRYANAIKQTINGNVLTINDISPLQEELEVSTNLMPYPYTETAVNGEFEYNNRQIVLNKSGMEQKHYMLAENFTLNAGVYTFKVLFDKLPVGVPMDSVAVAIYDASTSGMVINSLLTTPNPETTFTLESSNASVSIEMYVSGYDSLTLEPIVLTNYRLTPILTKDATEVFASGKNLFTTSNREIRDFGTRDVQADRTFDEDSIYIGVSRANYYQPYWLYDNWSAPLKGTPLYDITYPKNIKLKTKKAGYGLGFNFKVSPKESYVISWYIEDSLDSIGVGFFSKDGVYLNQEITTETKGTTIKDSGKDKRVLKFTTPENCYWILVVLTTQRSGEVNFQNVQIELGTTVTSYEDYAEVQKIESDADGIVKGIKPINPTTVIYNHSGADLECTYNVDTKKYIDNKFAQLTASLTSGVSE